jgi:hypothetical protein
MHATCCDNSDVRHRQPVGTHYPRRYGFGKQSVPDSEYEFLSGCILYWWTRVWANNTRRAGAHCHLRDRGATDLDAPMLVRHQP